MKKRKPYRKPRLERVRLLPEETMLSGCKLDTGAGGKNEKCPPITGGCKDISGT